MSVRTYLVIGIVIGLITFGISQFFGADIAGWLREQQFEAAIRGQRFIEAVVYDPIIFVMETPTVGAVIAALAWPAVLIWLLLLLIAVVLVPGLDVVRDIEEVTSLLLS